MQLAGWYPFTVLWCVDYVEQSRSILESVFAEAQKRVGSPGPRLDQLIEELAHGVGRAIWRDIEHAAEEGARPDGRCTSSRAPARSSPPRGRDSACGIVAESEGALALAALLAAMRTEAYAAEAGAFFAMLESVDLWRRRLQPQPVLPARQRPRRRLGRGSGPPAPGAPALASATSSGSRCRPTAAPTSISSPAPSAATRDPLREAAALEKDKRGLPARIAAAARPGRAEVARLGRPDVDLVPIDWPKKREPAAATGRLDQIRLVYQSDVAGRLQGILAAHRRRRAAPANPKGE